MEADTKRIICMPGSWPRLALLAAAAIIASGCSAIAPAALTGCSDTTEACAVAAIGQHSERLNRDSIKFLTQRLTEPSRMFGGGAPPELDFCVQIDSMEQSAEEISRAVAALRTIELRDMHGNPAPCR